jgi:integrase
VTPKRVDEFIAHLAEGRSESSVRNVVNALRAAYGTAMRRGEVRSNPCANCVIRRSEVVQEDDESVKVFTTEQLEAFLSRAPDRHKLLFRTLAATGLRISEAIALRWRDVGSDCVRVRRAYVRGSYGPPKSRHGRREVPISLSLSDDLRASRNGADDDALVFPSEVGTPIHYSNLYRRVIAPLAQELGAPAGAHVFRHTFASMHIAQGTNIRQLSHLLGHHSPSFTLDTYVHLMDDDAGQPITLPGENAVRTDALSIDDTAPDTIPAEWADSLPDDTPQDAPVTFPS